MLSAKLRLLCSGHSGLRIASVCRLVDHCIHQPEIQKGDAQHNDERWRFKWYIFSPVLCIDQCLEILWCVLEPSHVNSHCHIWVHVILMTDSSPNTLVSQVAFYWISSSKHIFLIDIGMTIPTVGRPMTQSTAVWNTPQCSQFINSARMFHIHARMTPIANLCGLLCYSRIGLIYYFVIPDAQGALQVTETVVLAMASMLTCQSIPHYRSG